MGKKVPPALWPSLLLFVSALVHELAHSVVATAHGLSVRGITLHVFGGVSRLEDEAPTPRAEALIAVAGPLASFAIAAVLWGLRAGGLADGGSTGAIAAYRFTVNLLVGVFNLIPGFPLDGGRLLRALLWHWKGSRPRATYLASRVGVRRRLRERHVARADRALPAERRERQRRTDRAARGARPSAGARDHAPAGRDADRAPDRHGIPGARARVRQWPRTPRGDRGRPAGRLPLDAGDIMHVLALRGLGQDAASRVLVPRPPSLRRAA